MSNIVKRNEENVILTIGDVQITDSESDDGLIILAKTVALIAGIGATATVSPWIATSLGIYGVVKLADFFRAFGKTSGVGNSLRDDVFGTSQAEREGWVPMPPDPVARSSDHLAEPSSPQIGAQTRLGAIEVPAQATTQTTASDWHPAPSVDPMSIVRGVSQRNNSFYICGSKGSGKGMFAANLIRWKLEQFPNAIAFVLDPKGDVKESGYWQHERIKVFSFRGIALSTSDLNQKVIEFLAEARHLISQADIVRGMRLFLVFDEFLFLKNNLSKELFSEISRLSSNAISTGDSEGIHAIAITQSFNAGDSVGSDEILKNLTLVGLFREDEYTRAKKVVNYGRVNTDQFSDAEFKSIASRSPVGRVMAIAGEFIPTPELENFSAFDRDSGKVIKPLPTGSNLSKGDHLARSIMQQVEAARKSMPIQDNELVKPEGEDMEQALIEYVKRKAPINLREIVRSACLKKFDITSTDDYRIFLETLAEEQKLSVDLEGNYY